MASCDGETGCRTTSFEQLGLDAATTTVGQLMRALGAEAEASICVGGARLPHEGSAKLVDLDVALVDSPEVAVCPRFRCGEELLCCPDAVLRKRPEPQLGLERFLTLWILLAAAAGIGIGQIPHVEVVFERLRVGNTNLLTAVGMIAMLLPPFAAVRYDELIPRIRGIPKRISIGSVVVNWLVGPLLTAGLGAAMLSNNRELLEGVIFIGAARCIAMVLVWTALAGGDSFLCVALVLLNSGITVLTYAPVVTVLGAFVGTTSGVGFLTVLLNVAIYLGIPLAIGVAIWAVGHRYEGYWTTFLPRFAPVGLLALLWTVLIMFCEMSKPLLSGTVQLATVALVVVPMLLYFVLMFSLSWAAGRWLLGITFEQNVTFAFTAASNNFELALAACTAIFGTSSKQAIATVLGPLIEIPVMLALVRVAKGLKYPSDAESKGAEGAAAVPETSAEPPAQG